MFPSPPYRAWHLELKVKNLLGSVPANPEQLQYWARERKRQFPYLDDKALEEMISEVINELRLFPVETEEEGEALNIQVFRRNAKGRYIEYYHIVGWLYEAASAQGLTRTLANFKLSTWAVGPNGQREIVVLPSKPVKDKDGNVKYVIEKLPIEMRMVRAITAKGPRQALVFHEIIEGPITITCDVYSSHPKLTDEIMELLVEVGKQIGLGPGRTHGYGKIIEAKVEPLQPGTLEEKK